MNLTQKNKRVLGEIVALDGQCLDSKRCLDCPFKTKCLPEFLYPKPLTQKQRLNMALDALSGNLLLDDEINLETIETDNKNK